MPKSIPTPEQDVKKLLSLLEGKRQGLRSSVLLNKYFRQNGVTRLLTAIRAAKANVEFYPPASGSGTHALTLFHPTIQPYTNSRLERNKQVLADSKAGMTPLEISKKHNIVHGVDTRTRPVNEIIAKQQYLDNLKDWILNSKETGEPREKYSASKEEQHTKEDAYYTLKNSHKFFEIDFLPTRRQFEKAIKDTPITVLRPEQLFDINNVAATRDMLGKGLKNPSIIKGSGLIDQRTSSWESVCYHAKHPNQAPIIIVKHLNNKMLLDGDHRSMASVLTDTPIEAKIIDLDELQDKHNKKVKYMLEMPKNAHPAISGFEIEDYIRHIADKYKDNEDVNALTHHILTGGNSLQNYDATGLYALNDKLQELEEPTYDYYNLLKAASALHLDNALNTLINSLNAKAERAFTPYPNSPYRNRVVGLNERWANINQIKSILNNTGILFRGGSVPQAIDPIIKEGLDILKKQGHSTEDINNSLDRHMYRNRLAETASPEEVTRGEIPKPHALKPASESPTPRYKLKDKLLKYFKKLKYIATPSKQDLNREDREQGILKLVSSMMTHIGPMRVHLIASKDARDKGLGDLADIHYMLANKHDSEFNKLYLQGKKQFGKEFQDHITDSLDLADQIPWPTKESEEVQKAHEDIKNLNKRLLYSKEFLDSIPIKYHSAPAISSFIQAARQLESRSQEVRRVVPAAQYKKFGFQVENILDSIADSPNTSSANTSHIIKHDGDMNKVRAAIALVAQQLNTPSYLAMNANPNGPDSMYQFDVSGGANELRDKLDNAGIQTRTFLKKPDNSGWWVLVYDKGNQMKGAIDSFAAKNRLSPTVIRGSGEFVGSGTQAEATKEDRGDTLKGIRQFERTGQYPKKGQPQQYQQDTEVLKYKLLAKILKDSVKPTKVKYGQEDVNLLLNSMTHNDFAGNSQADHNKRGVLADAYQELDSSPERETEANLIRSKKPFIMREGRPIPAVERIVRPINSYTADSGFIRHIIQHKYTPQQIIDEIASIPLHSFLNSTYLSPAMRSRTRLILDNPEMVARQYPTFKHLTADTKGTGWFIRHEKDVHNYPPNRDNWAAYKSILIPAENAHHMYLNPATGETS